MQSATKRELFGGALRSAGLVVFVATSSAAAEFVPYGPPPAHSNNYTAIAARDTADETLFFTWDITQDAAFADDLNYSGQGGTVASYATRHAFGAAVSIGDSSAWNYAVGVVRQWFTVDQPTEVLLEWDFDAASPKWNYVYLSEVYFDAPLAGAGLSDLDGSGVTFTSGTGAVTFLLEPGTVYLFVGRTSTWFGTGLGDVSFRLSVVPAPSALAIFGLATAIRRRRRRT